MVIFQKINDRISTSWLGFLTSHIISYFEFKLLSYYKDKNVIKLIKKIMVEDKPFLFKPSELFMIYSIARSQKSVNGDYAEVGVFKGTSAKVICEIKGDKKLYLFDTFDGIPSVEKIDTKFSEKLFKSNYDYVKKKTFGL